MEFLSSAEPEAAAALLHQEFPELRIHRIEATPQGMDNYSFVVNGDWIFRFPRAEEFRMRQELWALRGLRGKTTLPIPDPAWVGSGCACLGYRLLPGERLQPHLTTLNGDEKTRLVAELVELMAEIHVGLDVAGGLEHGLTIERPGFDALNGDRPIPADWRCLAEPMLARVRAIVPEETVIHNDLHCENVLFDPSSRTITGVIDFGDISVGDPAADLGYLLEIDIGASEAIARRYRAVSGRAVDPERILDLYFLLSLDGWARDDVPDPWYVADLERTCAYLRP